MVVIFAMLSIFLILIGIGMLVFFTNISEAAALVLLLLVFVPIGLHRYFGVTTKPILSTKARLIKKKRAIGTRGEAYHAWFLLPDKSTSGLVVSKEQFNFIEVNDVVWLTYKGYECVSFQRETDKEPIMNKRLRLSKKDKQKYLDITKKANPPS